jgi:hypothetical protein
LFLRVLERWDGRDVAKRLAPGMFALSLVYLVGFAGLMICLVDVPRLSEAIHVAAAERRGETTINELEDPLFRQWVIPAQRLGGWILVGLACLWPIFLIESAWTLWRSPRDRVTRGQWIMTGAIALLPPLRMARHHPGVRGRVWLPRMHWRRPGKRTQRELERSFSVPMIFIALLILPVLIVEWTLNDRIVAYPWLRVLLHVSTGGIWLAFVCEFVVMISVAPRRLEYCKKHWLDLAIILLPLISFLRTLRLLRASRLASLTQVQKITKIVRVYRLRGVSMRFFRALLVLDVLQRLFFSKPEKRLARLYIQLQIKEEELEDLRREIATLEAMKELDEQQKREEAQDVSEGEEAAPAELVKETRELNQPTEPSRASVLKEAGDG